MPTTGLIVLHGNRLEDLLAAVAGWLRLPFWPCAGWMLAGKFLRYVVMTVALLELFPGGIPGFTP